MTDINTQANLTALGMALEDLEHQIRNLNRSDLKVYEYDEVNDEYVQVDDDVVFAPIRDVLSELYKLHPEYKPTGSVIR